MDRRLAAIVAADVSDYSLLLGRDEQTTLKTLNQILDEIVAPSIAKYHGQIIRLMGDGSIIAFNSALHAVNFCVDVQRIIAKRKISNNTRTNMEFRMGANIGDIVRERNDIHGEGINVAVRLEELAPPGGLCLSDTMYRQIRSSLSEDLSPMGERHLKNIDEPILVWRWHPGNMRGASSGAMRKGERSGRQILDPKVTSSMVDLYIRSARLAMSDAFDHMLVASKAGAELSLREIHKVIEARLNAARGPLDPIYIQSARHRQRRDPQTLGDFLSDALNGRDIVFTVEMLEQIQQVLASDVTAAEKREALMRLCSAYLREKELPRVKAAIRFAFVDP